MNNQPRYYIDSAIVVLLVCIVGVFSYSVETQKQKLFKELENIHQGLEYTAQQGLNAIAYLAAAQHHHLTEYDEELEVEYAPKIHAIEPKGSFALDIEGMTNLTGYGGLSTDESILREMEVAIRLDAFFKTVHRLNRNFAWTYYISKHRFYAMYPYVPSNYFAWNDKNAKLPLWTEALPENNPDGRSFVTPLYVDGVGLGLMVTLGQPIYDKDEFQGTVNIDLTVRSISDYLVRHNLNEGHYFVINQHSEVLGSSELEFDRKKLQKAIDFLPSEIFEMESTIGLVAQDGKFFYVKSYKNTPWKLVYYKNQFRIYLNAFLLTIPLFLLIIAVVRIRFLFREIENLAYLDTLTHIHNRRYFSEIAKTFLSLAKREQSPISIALIDIDFFKTINDTYGHDKGDEALVVLADTIRNMIRESDVFARHGGDEFILLFPSTNLEKAVKKAQKIASAIIEESEANELPFTLSIGVYEVDLQTDSVDDAVKMADKRLYLAKELGRNRVVSTGV